MEDGVVIGAKIRKVKNVEVLYMKSIATSAAAYIYDLYTFSVVCTLFVCTKNIQRPFQLLASCIGFV